MTTQPLSPRVEPALLSAASRPREISASRAVLLGGLTVGTLDILDAIVFFGLYVDASPTRIFQSVASGLLGREAARSGGLATAVLGGVLHFTIAFIIVTIYFVASRRWRLLTVRPVPCGLAYGVACYFVMSFVVVPLSAAGPPGVTFNWPALPSLLNGIVGHALLVGLPSALWARRAVR